MSSFSIWHWLIAAAMLYGAWRLLRFLRDRTSTPMKTYGELELRGVGGWLRFYIVASALVGPLFGASKIATALSEAERANPALLGFVPWSNYKTATWVTLGLATIWMLRVVYGLNNRPVPVSATRNKWTLLLLPVVITIADTFSAILILDVWPDAEIVGALIGTMVPSLIWLAYFVMSKRVLNTYYGGNRDFSWSWLDEPIRSATASTSSRTAHPADFDLPVAAVSTVESNVASLSARLTELRSLRDQGLITGDDYERKKEHLLKLI